MTYKVSGFGLAPNRLKAITGISVGSGNLQPVTNLYNSIFRILYPILVHFYVNTFLLVNTVHLNVCSMYVCAFTYLCRTIAHELMLFV